MNNVYEDRVIVDIIKLRLELDELKTKVSELKESLN